MVLEEKATLISLAMNLDTQNGWTSQEKAITAAITMRADSFFSLMIPC